MVEIKKGDFIQVQYTGKLEDGTAFDTTSKKEAEKQGLDNTNSQFGPVIICIGENHLVKGLDDRMIGKKVGEVYNIDIPAEEGFGKKDAKLIQMIATNKFTKENIKPMPGLQVNVDGSMGVIKNVSGGRTLVDFNHPLAGQNLRYEIRIDKIVDDDAEKVKALLDLNIGLKKCDIEIKDSKAMITTDKDLGIPEEVVKALGEEISRLVPSVKEITISKTSGKPSEQGKTADKPE